MPEQSLHGTKNIFVGRIDIPFYTPEEYISSL